MHSFSFDHIILLGHISRRRHNMHRLTALLCLRSFFSGGKFAQVLTAAVAKR